jgi:hypothetical protein
MADDDRIRFALEHVAENSVFIIDRMDWEKMVDKSGEPIRIESVPPALSGLVSVAAHVMTAGSGILNTSPGMDVVRLDPADAPYIYNIYHYTVLENFSSAPIYQQVLDVARVEETAELDGFIKDHVFIVGPYREDNHWVVEIPEHIINAKYKSQRPSD